MSRPNNLDKSFIENRSVPVPETGCWLWDEYHMVGGYGHLRIKGQKILAHRASYIAFFGDIPEGFVVRHKCDVRCCVNPAHLELGTQQDNINDRNSRGRTARGSKASRTKLSDRDVRDIRSSTLSRKELAIKYSISPTYVTNLIARRDRPYVQ